MLCRDFNICHSKINTLTILRTNTKGCLKCNLFFFFTNTLAAGTQALDGLDRCGKHTASQIFFFIFPVFPGFSLFFFLFVLTDIENIHPHLPDFQLSVKSYIGPNPPLFAKNKIIHLDFSYS